MTTKYIIVLIIVVFSSCSGFNSIKDGNEAFKLQHYALATELLQKEFSKAKTEQHQFDLAVKIAQAYDNYGSYADALIWYQRAIDFDLNEEIRLEYVGLLKKNEQYEDAIEEIKKILNTDPMQRLWASKELEACQQALKCSTEANFTTVVNEQKINSEAYDYSPVMKNNILYFTSTRTNSDLVDPYTNDNYADIYEVFNSTQEGTAIIQRWSNDLNSPFHDATIAFSSDSLEAYITRCGSEDKSGNDLCQIYVSFNEGYGDWSNPARISLFEESDSVNVGHPFLAEDGDLMYFSSNHELGYGGRDLYMSRRVSGEWETPINLGPKVNTAGDELFPFISEDDKLFFSSNGHGGFGGLDIFRAEKIGRIYSNVTSLGCEINSGADDFGIFLTESEDDSVEIKGYFSSNRVGGMGNDDIYSFERRLPPFVKPPPPVFILHLDIVENLYEKPKDPSSEIKGKIPVENVDVSLFDISNKQPYLVDQKFSNKQGKITMQLDEQTNYKIHLAKTGYFNLNPNLSTVDIAAKDGDTITINRRATIEKVFEALEITVNNIYYDLDKWNIRDDAALVLDSLALILLDNPKLKVELGSHTDARGNDDYNQELSQKRAQSAVDHLISKGINPQRLIAKGYGESVLINQCDDNTTCTEEEHQKNRRTTFKILATDFVISSETINNPENGQ